MRILLGLDPLRPPLTGIGSYTKHLAEELIRMPDLEVGGYGFGNIFSPEKMIKLLSATYLLQNKSATGQDHIKNRLREIPGAYALLKTLMHRSMKQKLEHSNLKFLCHAPDFILPRSSGRNVVTIHDLSHLKYPETHPPARVKWLKKMLPETLRRASGIITVSEYIRKELLESGLIPDGKPVYAIPNGCSAGFHPRNRDMVLPTLAKYKLGWRRFILGVGTLEPRKNPSGLVEAYLKLPDEVTESFPLILVGVKGWKNQQLNKILSHVTPVKNIHLTGYLPEKEVQELTASAAVFVYPSLYEGFGLPVLEAMASGTAVLTSNRGALAELGEKGAMLVNPEKPSAISKSMEIMLTDPEENRKWQKAGRKKAALYSWKKCATMTSDVYRMVNG
ncbi:glycosyltransferase family 4 protein [Desulfobotulus mexicanus]|nr:glycosyltransferase family 1 protein [Desulfobotulus mexicanus]